MNIKQRLATVSVGLIVVCVLLQMLVFLFANDGISKQTVDLNNELYKRGNIRSDNEIGALGQSLIVFLTEEEDRIDDSMYHAALVLQKLDTLGDITLRDMETLLRELRVDDLYLTDMDGYFTVSTVPGAVGGIGLFEIWEGYRMLVTGEATELPSAIKIMVETGEIYKFTAVPRYDENGNIKGIVESALEVSAIEKSMGAMIAGYDMIYSMHLFEPDGLTLMSVEKPSAKASFIKGAIAQIPNITSTLTENDDDGTITYYTTVNRFGGPAYIMRLELDAAYFAEDSLYVSGALEGLKQGSSNNLLLVVGVGLVSMVIIMVAYLFLVHRSILRPIIHLQAIINRVSHGDVSPVDAINRKDEFGRLEREVADMVNAINNQANTLGQIADGDYTATVTVRSDKDAMNIAFEKMLGNLNHTFNEINASTAQVSSGSKQLADGSQILAQGSTQQAAAVEELSSSITEIAQKTKANAETAGRTAALASAIKQSAEKGSRQMDEMLTAVKEINEAGQSINKVIKVIDDIAFQTNILALNAAVEAARAGQHGKGFAVVAEEVRNLASKSADAAKETGNLIANSTEKAQLGSRIASETAASLAEIVTGINESNQFINEIAQSSEQQSAGIAHINAGIGQVAQVIQQNSATAEESAAASEEMSGQANMLEDLIAQFKLKDGGGTRRSLSSPSPRKQIAMPEKAELPDGEENGKY
ncbi:MAG: HAMP domain-containing methyl-accepting chemotaxis protein [Oscillospiraceae bacterium]|nr:HAMP domain-containing methyl-accepting chemotaxis protein [Oscillospiraceae bacterium]